MKQSLLFLTFLSFLSACKKESPHETPQPVSNRIRFDALAVGQVSRYAGLNGYGYFSEKYDDYLYTDDTLRLEIVAHDANGYKVEEKWEYHGSINAWYNALWKDSVFYYYLSVANDTLRVKPVGSNTLRSRIFTKTIEQQGLPLKKIESPKVEILGWRTSFPPWEGRREGFAADYSLFGKSYGHLNVIQENTAMARDGNGMTYIFSKPFGIVRFSTYSPWTGQGYGWDLLPEIKN